MAVALTGRRASAPLIERDGVLFWQVACAALSLALLAIAFLHFGR